MSDKDIVKKLIANDPVTIKEFFFVRCRGALTYIGQYFFQDKQTPEELIGDFYEFLSAGDWHKLRIFKFTCSLNSYVTIIASRYFQRKRDKEMKSLDEDEYIMRTMGVENNHDSFLVEDISKVMNSMHPFDRFLVQRILLDGEKPRDILREAEDLMKRDTTIKTDAKNKKQFASYIYTRYNRVKQSMQKQMATLGYDR